MGIYPNINLLYKFSGMEKLMIFIGRILFLLISVFCLFSCSSVETGSQTDDDSTNTNNKPMYVFIGTYTQTQDTSIEQSKGIYVYKFDPANGSLSFVSVSPQTTNPSYLAIHPSKNWLYSVNETGGENETGNLSAFKINKESKELEFLNSVSSKGTYPCHISIDHTGKFALTANYGSGNVALFKINNDGTLSHAISEHQHLPKASDGPDVKPRAHMILQGPVNQMVYSTDLGTNMIWVYKLDTDSGKLKPARQHIPVQNGAGPRHMVFHPKNAWVYVVNEKNGTIEGFTSDHPSGIWNRFQTIPTIPANESRPAACADIHIAPSGRFLYASNRGEINTLAIYEINQQSGELTALGYQDVGGRAPRNFAIDPSGNFILVANHRSNSIVVFKINRETGKLTKTANSIAIPAPVCIKFL
jgi:6-phosphogluconolactonase